MNDIANNNSNHNIDIVDSSPLSIHTFTYGEKYVRIFYTKTHPHQIHYVCVFVLFERCLTRVSANELNREKKSKKKTQN